MCTVKWLFTWISFIEKLLQEQKRKDKQITAGETSKGNVCWVELCAAVCKWNWNQNGTTEKIHQCHSMAWHFGLVWFADQHDRAYRIWWWWQSDCKREWFYGIGWSNVSAHKNVYDSNHLRRDHFTSNAIWECVVKQIEKNLFLLCDTETMLDASIALCVHSKYMTHG